MEKSCFDGTVAQIMFIHLLCALITIPTLGLAFPWAFCLLQKWKLRHTIINGHRLKFVGKPVNLTRTWLRWYLLSIITFGMYIFWVGIGLEKWKTQYIVLEKPQ
ncbi:hypothetical protein FACS189418_4700 [Clostridia bacterium]|nr:hypothetical protein FACS189418_4700 [Clostridia bacterium]